MGQRAEALAQRLEAANQEAISAVQQLGDDQWRAQTKEEGWTVAATTHHMATSHEGLTGLVQALANSQQLPPITMDMINQGNAQAAQQFANADRNECLDLLRSGGEKAVSVVRGLSDEHLDRAGTLLGQPWTTQQVIENILIGHVQGHLASIRGASA